MYKCSAYDCSANSAAFTKLQPTSPGSNVGNINVAFTNDPNTGKLILALAGVSNATNTTNAGNAIVRCLNTGCSSYTQTNISNSNAYGGTKSMAPVVDTAGNLYVFQTRNAASSLFYTYMLTGAGTIGVDLGSTALRFNNLYLGGDLFARKGIFTGPISFSVQNTPVGPSQGDTYYDSTTKKFMGWNGTRWLDLSWADTLYGEIHYNNDTGVAISTTVGSTFPLPNSTVTVGVTDGASGGTTASATTNKFTIGSQGAGTYEVTASIAAIAANNAEVHALWRINSTDQTKTTGEVIMPGGAHAMGITAHGFLTLAASDTVDVVFSSSAATDTITVYHFNATIHRISK